MRAAAVFDWYVVLSTLIMERLSEGVVLVGLGNMVNAVGRHFECMNYA